MLIDDVSNEMDLLTSLRGYSFDDHELVNLFEVEDYIRRVQTELMPDATSDDFEFWRMNLPYVTSDKGDNGVSIYSIFYPKELRIEGADRAHVFCGELHVYLVSSEGYITREERGVKSLDSGYCEITSMSNSTKHITNSIKKYIRDLKYNDELFDRGALFSNSSNASIAIGSNKNVFYFLNPELDWDTNVELYKRAMDVSDEECNSVPCVISHISPNINGNVVDTTLIANVLQNSLRHHIRAFDFINGKEFKSMPIAFYNFIVEGKCNTTSFNRYNFLNSLKDVCLKSSPSVLSFTDDSEFECYEGYLKVFHVLSLYNNNGDFTKNMIDLIDSGSIVGTNKHLKQLKNDNYLKSFTHEQFSHAINILLYTDLTSDESLGLLRSGINVNSCLNLLKKFHLNSDEKLIVKLLKSFSNDLDHVTKLGTKDDLKKLKQKFGFLKAHDGSLKTSLQDWKYITYAENIRDLESYCCDLIESIIARDIERSDFSDVLLSNNCIQIVNNKIEIDYSRINMIGHLLLNDCYHSTLDFISGLDEIINDISNNSDLTELLELSRRLIRSDFYDDCKVNPINITVFDDLKEYLSNTQLDVGLQEKFDFLLLSIPKDYFDYSKSKVDSDMINDFFSIQSYVKNLFDNDSLLTNVYKSKLLHDKLTQEVLTRRESALSNMVGLDRFSWKPSIAPVTHNGYCVVPMSSLVDLLHEGKVMHHCVASYYGICSSGRSFVFSVKGEDGLSLATLELKESLVIIDGVEKFGVEVVQCRGVRNAPVTDNGVLEVVDHLVNGINNGDIDFNRYPGIVDGVDLLESDVLRYKDVFYVSPTSNYDDFLFTTDCLNKISPQSLCVHSLYKDMGLSLLLNSKISSRRLDSTIEVSNNKNLSYEVSSTR
ncbi:PcfJ domain-containing protein [Photobacterium leiognathi]|uniref:PcfJ domain-containing protein n=1 Tax=Photobacterium leiognathi TaxID=553611 RepID=UPI002981CCAC|nr:PcfJ domain-containing protein [Photobacterium leiognathi]